MDNTPIYLMTTMALAGEFEALLDDITDVKHSENALAQRALRVSALWLELRSRGFDVGWTAHTYNVY